MKDYKTVREIAEELGVSKQAVRNKIAKLGLQSSLRKNGNKVCVNEKQETLIKSAFLQKEEIKSPSENDNQFAKNDNQFAKNDNQFAKNDNQFAKNDNQFAKIIELLEKQNNDLKFELDSKENQLHKKDNQIEELNKRLSEAHVIINQTQQLHGADKLLEIQEPIADPVSQEATQKEQKSFFSKLFNK